MHLNSAKKTFPTLLDLHQPEFIDTRQGGSMNPCCWCQILTLPSVCISRNWDSSDQAIFSQSSADQFWWACDHCSLSILHLADRGGTRHGLLKVYCTYCSPPQGLSCILRCFSAQFEPDWSFFINPFRSARGFLAQNCSRTGCFSFIVLSSLYHSG